MAIRVLVNGAAGKMGQETVKAVNAAEDLELVGQADKDDNLIEKIKSTQAQVVVDFTTAEVGYANVKAIIEANAHPVIGTTGFTQDQVDQLAKLCAEKKLGAIIAPNFSMGAILMMKCAQECARYFPHVEIIELHHDQKVDSPSGTAVKTAQMIGEIKEKTHPKVREKEIIPGARGANYKDMHIHSIRLPGLVAHQAVMFGNTGETLTIRHDMVHREASMYGVILACRKVMDLKHLVYGLENILD